MYKISYKGGICVGELKRGDNIFRMMIEPLCHAENVCFIMFKGSTSHVED
jgi:hypothetical protein